VEEEAFRKMESLFDGESMEQYEKVCICEEEPFDIDMDDVKFTLKEYPLAKTGGPDRIHTKFLRCLLGTDKFLPTLTLLFRLFTVAGVTPSDWNESTIFLNLKSMNDKSLNNARPLTLTNILRRLYEKIVLRHIERTHNENPGESWCRLNDGQAGFRRKYSTLIQILLSDQLSRMGRNISVFLDLKGAYDRVWHGKLFTILEERGCPQHLVSLFYSLMVHKLRSRVVVNACRSDREISRKRGLQQGSILSPLLFNIYIDGLAQTLNEGLNIPRGLLYADDIGIKAKTVGEAQQMLDICQIWAMEHRMEWGIMKCGVVGTAEDLLLSGEVLPKVSYYKYLGVPHKALGIDWKVSLTKRTDHTLAFLNATMDLARSWPFISRLVVYRAFARPLGEYCLVPAYLWSQRQPETTKKEMLKRIKDTHSRGIQWVSQTRDRNKVVESVTGLGSAEDRLEILHASLAQHLLKMDATQPLYRVKGELGANVVNRNTILHMCERSKLRREMEREGDGAPIMMSTIKKYARKKWVKEQGESKLPLLKIVVDRSESGVDKVLLEAPLHLQDDVLRWRLNKSLVPPRECGSCTRDRQINNTATGTAADGEKILMTRGHLNRCPTFISYLQTHFTAKYQRYETWLRSEEANSRWPDHANFLDATLNDYDFDDFKTILNQIFIIRLFPD
jgi:hypothetical protein